MAFFLHPLSNYEKKNILHLAKSYMDNPQLFTCLQIVLLSHQRYKTSEISSQLQIRKEDASYWIKQYNQRGLKCFEQTLLETASKRPHEKEKAWPESKLALAESSEVSTSFVATITATQMTEIQRLRELYKDNPRVLRHIRAILLSYEGLDSSAISENLGFSIQPSWRIRFWIEQFNQHGVSTLVTKSDQSWLAQQQKLSQKETRQASSPSSPHLTASPFIYTLLKNLAVAACPDQPNLGKRSQIILLLLEGSSIEQVARILGVARGTVRTWCNRWQQAQLEVVEARLQADTLEAESENIVVSKILQEHLYQVLSDKR
jgi:transposase